MFHHICGDVGAGSPQARLAVYSDGAALVLAQVQEGLQDLLCGVAAIFVVQVHVSAQKEK